MPKTQNVDTDAVLKDLQAFQRRLSGFIDYHAESASSDVVELNAYLTLFKQLQVAELELLQLQLNQRKAELVVE